MPEAHDGERPAFDDHAFAEELRRLDEERRDHPGFIAKQRWDGVMRSLRIVQANAAELLAVLRAPNANVELAMELFQNVHESPARELYFGAVDQKLFNLIASVRALVDHRRRLLKNYAETHFADEFASRNDAVRDLPESRFIGAFRNYLEHYGVAPLVHQMSWKQGGTFDTRMRVDSRALLASNMNWTAPEGEAIEALDPSGEGIDLDGVLTAYLAALDDLNQWWASQFQTLHGAEIDDANALIERYNLHLTGGRVKTKGDWHDILAQVGDEIAARNQADESGPAAGEEPRGAEH